MIAISILVLGRQRHPYKRNGIARLQNRELNGWMERYSTSSRNGPLPRAGVDHSTPQPLARALTFRVHCGPHSFLAQVIIFLVPDAVIHTSQITHAKPAGIVK
jgi:hypothetical protein